MITRLYKAIIIAIMLATGSIWAAEISGSIPNPLTTTYTVGSGNYLQSSSLSLAINSGGTLAVTDPSWETIFQQNASGTSIVNLHPGGTRSFSGRKLYDFIWV